MAECGHMEQRKARKRHICYLCKKAILPGNQYIYETQKFEGRFQTLRRHIHCDAILDAWYREYENGDGTYTPEGIYEDLRDYVCGELCSEEQYDECDGDFEVPFACELCQKKLLSPSALQAARESVRANWEGMYEM